MLFRKIENFLWNNKYTIIMVFSLTIGIACVCIAGMFGSFNWKWLVAILIGVFVIAFAEGVGSIATDGPDLGAGS